MAFTVNPETGRIEFGVVSDGTHDAIAIDFASQFGVSEDFKDNFETATNWVESASGVYTVNTINKNIDFDAIGGTNDTIVHDLGVGNVANTWTLRFKMNFSTLASGVATNAFFGLSDSDETEGAVTIQNHIMIRVNNTTDGGGTFGYAGIDSITQTPNGVGNNDLETFIWQENTDYYFELVRTSTTTYTVKVFSDAEYTSLISAGSTSATSVDVTGLRYIKFTGIESGGAGGDIIGTIDDVQFWNGITVPVITSLNWRLRYKLELTNIDDGASATDKTLFFGLGDSDGLASSSVLQDGYFLRAFTNTGPDAFHVLTPDNEAPRTKVADVVMTTTPSVTTFFVEMVRDSASQTTFNFYTDGTFASLLDTETQAGVSGSDNLKYLKAFNDNVASASGAIDGSIDDITFTDLGVASPTMDKPFTINALLKATLIEEFQVDTFSQAVFIEDFLVDAILQLVDIDKTFIIDSTLVFAQMTCSPWKKFSEADGSSSRVTINQGDGQGYEIPPVTVPTQVTGIKCSVKTVSSSQGSVSMRIATFPQSQLANGNFSTIANGDSTNQINMSVLFNSFEDFTFLFNGAVLEPNQRYMIIFNDNVGNGTGMDYETILTSTRDYKEYAVLYQDPGGGTPLRYARVVATNRAPAVDIEVANEGMLACVLVDALLEAEDAWEFREQRFSNANLINAPDFTLGTDGTRLQISAPTGSDGRGWLFKSFKKTDINGNSILIEGDGLQETRIRVYDGKYKRQYFGDFEPANGNDPVTPLDGIGLLGSASANPLVTSLLLPAVSINYAGSTEEFITFMISCRQSDDALVAELNLSAITMSPFRKWSFDTVAGHSSLLTNVAPDDGWVTTAGGQVPVPSGGVANYIMTKDGSNDTVAQDFSDVSRLGSTLGTDWRLRLQVEFTSLSTSTVPNDLFLSVSDQDQTVNQVTGSEDSIGFRFRNVNTGTELALYKKSGATQTITTIPSYNFTLATNFVEITRIGNLADIKVYTDATFTVVTDSVTGIDVSDIPTGQLYWKWGNDGNLVSGESNINGVPGIVGLEIAPSSGSSFITVTEDTTTGGGETDWGYARASSTAQPFMEHTFELDACVGIFAGRRSDIGALIVKVLVANPAGLTGLQILDEVRLLRDTSKTSRIKNWIGFLRNRGIIVDDGSSPDWYKTVWTVV